MGDTGALEVVEQGRVVRGVPAPVVRVVDARQQLVVGQPVDLVERHVGQTQVLAQLHRAGIVGDPQGRHASLQRGHVSVEPGTEGEARPSHMIHPFV